jgi:hypothetical protein
VLTDLQLPWLCWGQQAHLLHVHLCRLVFNQSHCRGASKVLGGA